MIFDTCILIFHTCMHLSAHNMVSFHCVSPKLVFFSHFPISLLTFCQYAIMIIIIMTFICYMFHVYINQFGAH